MKKRLNRYNISKNDFEIALEYLKELNQVKSNSYAFEALWMMGIISYYRPFTCNEKKRNSRAGSKIDLPILTSEELKLHGILGSIRNKIIAHSEIKTNPTSTNSLTGIIWRRRANIWDILQEYKISKDNVIALAQKMLRYSHNESATLAKIA